MFSGRADPVSAFAWKGADDTVGNVVDVFDDGDDFTTEDWFIQGLKQSILGMNFKMNELLIESRTNKTEVRVSAMMVGPDPISSNPSLG